MTKSEMQERGKEALRYQGLNIQDDEKHALDRKKKGNVAYGKAICYYWVKPGHLKAINVNHGVVCGAWL